MPVYIIERKKGKVFHVIRGDALVYNEDDAKGDDAKEKGVAKIKADFEKIADSPNTHFRAVQVVTGTAFGGNTGTESGNQ